MSNAAFANRYIDLPEDGVGNVGSGDESIVGWLIVISIVLAFVFWDRAKGIVEAFGIIAAWVALCLILIVTGIFEFLFSKLFENPIIAVLVLGGMFFWALNDRFGNK